MFSFPNPWIVPVTAALLALYAIALCVVLAMPSNDPQRGMAQGLIGIVLLLLLLGAAVLGLGVYFRNAAVIWVVFSLTAYPAAMACAQYAFSALRPAPKIQPTGVFTSAKHGELAKAIQADDAALVQTLVQASPNVLNEVADRETLLMHALSRDGAHKADIVRILLAAGADPNVAGYMRPLELAMRQPALVKALLDAGADPNATDGAGRPVWWNPLNNRGGDIEDAVLHHLLDGGADINLRDADSGPVCYAAYASNWRAAWTLMQRGAAWKGESRYGKTLEELAHLADSTAGGEPLAEIRKRMQ